MSRKSEAAILVVSFGTSNHETREKTIGAVENAIAEAFPEYEVRRAFTSSFIVRKLRKEGIPVDDVSEALAKLASEGIRNLIVQPTHLMHGNEYEKLVGILEEEHSAGDRFETIVLGAPLLSGEKDIDDVITAITEDVKLICEGDVNAINAGREAVVRDDREAVVRDDREAGVSDDREAAVRDDSKTAVIFMGHGSDAKANAVYAAMQERLFARGFSDTYIATVEASPAFDEVLQVISGKDYRRVILQPLMVVAGDHALNDMAGEEESWKSRLIEAGYEVEAVLKGLGEIPAIQKIYVEHVMAVVY